MLEVGNITLPVHGVGAQPRVRQAGSPLEDGYPVLNVTS